MDSIGLKPCTNYSQTGSCEDGDSCSLSRAHKNCKFGMQCKKKDTCAFYHTEVRKCRFGEKCRNLPNCQFVH